MKLRTPTKQVIRSINAVLIRIDADVPTSNGRIRYLADDRLRAALPEIKKWRALNKQVVLMGHAGRPAGKRVKSLSLAPVATRLGSLLGETVKLVTLEEAQRAVHDGTKILLLENLRFDAQEKKNGKRFAKKLALLADIYINNAFSVSHRKHASMHAIHDHLDGYAGESLLREVKELSRPLRKPYFLALGGIKLKTRLPLIEHLAQDAEGILLGSGMSSVIASNTKVNFRVSSQERRIAKLLLKNFAEKLIFPVDIKISKGFAIDVGPKSITEYRKKLKGARTIIWNGPFGQIEKRGGMDGTYAFAKLLQRHEARVIIGGGDTVGYLRKRGALKGIDFVSTGGSAMLQFLAGKEMPGLEKLSFDIIKRI